MRCAFFYPWYPEQWSQAGHRYSSTMGNYDSANPAVIDNHISSMEYAKIDAGLYSWWGQGTPTDLRFTQHLDAGFTWAVLYEIDQDGRRSTSDVNADMAYLNQKYFNHENYLKIGTKPVVFVYAPDSRPSRNKTWKDISASGVFVAMTEFPQWWTVEDGVDSWYGYKPAERSAAVYNGSHVYSIAPSAGFWGAGESTPRLERDFAEWEAAVNSWTFYQPDWELVYWNEHGEGTIIEPSDARCEEYLCSDYLITLANA